MRKPVPVVKRTSNQQGLDSVESGAVHDGPAPYLKPLFRPMVQPARPPTDILANEAAPEWFPADVVMGEATPVQRASSLPPDSAPLLALGDLPADAGPVMRGLAQTCQARFMAQIASELGMAVTPSTVVALKQAGFVQELNGLAARVVQQVVREYFKDRLKAYNKSYDSASMPHGMQWKGIQGPVRQAEAYSVLDGLRQRRAPLEERVAAGVGNCLELSVLATVLARSLGLHADAWSYRSPEGGEPHMFCIIGQVPPGDASRASDTPELFGDTRAEHLWTVDPWSGVCCPSKDFDMNFLQKMKQWAKDGKVIWRLPTVWCRADDEVWLQETVFSNLDKKKSQPDNVPGYAIQPSC